MFYTYIKYSESHDCYWQATGTSVVQKAFKRKTLKACKKKYSSYTQWDKLEIR